MTSRGRTELEIVRWAFLAEQGKLRPIVEDTGGTVVFDPASSCLDVMHVAGWLLRSWKEDTAYDAALLRLAESVGNMLIDPTPATVDAWWSACIEHAVALREAG